MSIPHAGHKETISETSDFYPIPMCLINTKIWDFTQQRFVIHLSRSKVKTCLAVAKVRYVVRKTLIYVDSNSPSSVARLSTNLSRVPAFTNLTRTVSHSRCEISSSESCNSTSYRFIQLTCIAQEHDKQHCTASC